jgi:hypothetical protein
MNRALPPVLAVCFSVAIVLAATATADASSPRRKGVNPSGHVPFQAMTISIIENYRVRGLFTLEIGLDVPDTDLRAHVEKILPHLHDAFVRNLTVYGSTSMVASKPANLDVISQRLQAEADRIIGQKGAAILFNHALVRRLH